MPATISRSWSSRSRSSTPPPSAPARSAGGWRGMRWCSEPAVALLRLLTLAAAFAAAPRRAGAQLEQDCVRDVVDALPEGSLGAWRGQRPSDLRKRFAPLRAAGRWSAIADSIGAIYLAIGRPAGGSWP